MSDRGVLIIFLIRMLFAGRGQSGDSNARGSVYKLPSRFVRDSVVCPVWSPLMQSIVYACAALSVCACEFQGIPLVYYYVIYTVTTTLQPSDLQAQRLVNRHRLAHRPPYPLPELLLRVPGSCRGHTLPD